MLSSLSIGRVLANFAPAAGTRVGLPYHAVLWLFAAGEIIEAELTRQLDGIGITVEDFHVLAAHLCAGTERITTRFLARQTQLSPATAARAVIRLEGARLLGRNGRAGIRLTPLGKMKINTAITACHNCISQLIESHRIAPANAHLNSLSPSIPRTDAAFMQ